MNSLQLSKVKLWILVCMALVVTVNPCKAQQRDDTEAGTIPWGVTFGAYLSSRGGGGQINYLWGRGNRQLMISVDGNVLKDSRETLIESAFGERGGDYTYGKLNYVFSLSPTVGIQQNLFPSNDQNLINFRWSAQIGPSFAFVVPYKLAIFTPLAGRPNYGRPTFEAFDPESHSYEDIIRRAKLFDSEESSGLDASTEIGLSVRTNILIDFSRARDYVGGIQLGFGVDWYAEELPIMAFVENKQMYMSGTVGVVFGLRN